MLGFGLKIEENSEAYLQKKKIVTCCCISLLKSSEIYVCIDLMKLMKNDMLGSANGLQVVCNPLVSCAHTVTQTAAHINNLKRIHTSLGKRQT